MITFRPSATEAKESDRVAAITICRFWILSLWQQMEVFMCWMMFLSILGNRVHGLQAKSDSPALSYWKEKLPNTPIPNYLGALIPNTLRELIPLSPKNIEKGISTEGFGQYGQYNRYGDDKMLSYPSLTMFFMEKDLHDGIKMLLSFGKRSKGGQAYFLPRYLSDKIPFSSERVSIALENLNIPARSEAALTLKHTIEQCESHGIKGETKYCATSLESMIDYSISTVGTNDVNVLVTNVTKTPVKQQYTITTVQFQSKSGFIAVLCHAQVYAYAVYFCHNVKNTTTAKVSLKGENGTIVEGVAVCHADTSKWDPNHLAFKILNVEPGGPPVCHFISELDVAWLSTN